MKVNVMSPEVKVCEKETNPELRVKGKEELRGASFTVKSENRELSAHQYTSEIILILI